MNHATGQAGGGWAEPAGPLEGYVLERPATRPVPTVVVARAYQVCDAAPRGRPWLALPPLRPVLSGRAYVIVSPQPCGLVSPALAEALEAVFERFARSVGASEANPLQVGLARGFVPGSPGHGEGRAADILTVGGRSLRDWKWGWDRVLAIADQLMDPQRRSELVAAEGRRNLGYGLYRKLLGHGGWRVDQRGWRPYRGVVQLFGPWTATEGPWKAMDIPDPSPPEQCRLADQQRVLAAHQDHIHVAR